MRSILARIRKLLGLGPKAEPPEGGPRAPLLEA